MIQAMAGDIWKSQRADLAAGWRISLRLRHEPDPAGEAGSRRGDRGARWTPVLATVVPASHQQAAPPGSAYRASLPRLKREPSPLPGAGLALGLEQTVAGCDWLLDQWVRPDGAALR